MNVSYIKPEIFKLLPSKEIAELPKSKSDLAGTVSELALELDVWPTTVRRLLRELRKEGKAHIANWYRTPGAYKPVWARGNFPDVPQPEPLSTAKTCRRYRTKVAKAIQNGVRGKEYNDRYKHHVARAIADEVAERSRTNPQHWFSALGL